MTKGLSWAERRNTFLLYKNVPQWFDQSLVRNGYASDVSVIDFLTSVSEEQWAALTTSGKIPLHQLTPEQSLQLSTIFRAEYSDEPEERVNDTYKVLEKLAADRESRIQLMAEPVLYVYKDNRWVGKIFYNPKPAAWQYRLSKAPLGGSRGWDAPPKLIVPSVALDNEWKAKPISLENDVNKLSLAQLGTLIEKQTGLKITASQDLQTIDTLFIGRVWVLHDMLEMLCSVQGLELRSVGKTLILAKSRAHDAVAWEILATQIPRELQARLLKALSPVFSSNSFTKMSSPFDSELLQGAKLAAATSLTLPQQNVISKLLPDSDVNSLKIRFLTRYSLYWSLQGEGDNNYVLGFSKYTAADASDADLVKPEGNVWQQYPLAKWKELYQADFVEEDANARN
jgi:hypothetical protein